jgi:hypothetical protein
MKKDFKKVRDALEEHLSAINENTTEIQSMFDFLQEMEIKVDKLSQRLDNVQMSFGQPIEKPFVQPLDQLEKKIFLVLYTEEIPITYEEMSFKARVPLSTIPDCVSSLINKGIPLLRSRVNEQLFFKISPSFKDIQAKENLINLSLNSFID